MLKQLLDTLLHRRVTRLRGLSIDRDKPQQISDTSAIEADDRRGDRCESCAGCSSSSGGKRTVAAFFVGNVMRVSKGQANPTLLNELVVRKLDSLGAAS